MSGRALLKPAISRAIDIAASAGALLMLSPLMLLLSLVVLADGRPVVFRQKRIGKHGRPFWILKFRTMRPCPGGAAITAAGDRRITRTGAWLRRLKMDELPQFINVLRGEMSLIGPRPEVPDYVDPTDPLWRAVLESTPGITDLATLAFRNEEQLLGPEADPEIHYRSVILPAKLRLNITYQRSRTLARDLKLLWLTARYSFLPHGYDRDRVLRSLGA